jgi:copper homeostasis protein
MVMLDHIIVEIAAFTPSAAIAAQRAGAHRVELCSGYSEGGLSASVGTVNYVRKNISIPLHVMVRPRIGDFIYNEIEKECILAEIAFYKGIGVDGIVFGALKPDGNIDIDFLREIVDAAKPMSVTFHRAFDLCNNQSMALNDLIYCGVSRVLTSGGKQSVLEGIEQIALLVEQADNRIVILPGGEINAENVLAIVKKTGVIEVHLSGKMPVKSSLVPRSDINLTSFEGISDYEWYECSIDRVKRVLNVLKSNKAH